MSLFDHLKFNEYDGHTFECIHNLLFWFRQRQHSHIFMTLLKTHWPNRTNNRVEMKTIVAQTAAVINNAWNGFIKVDAWRQEIALRPVVKINSLTFAFRMRWLFDVGFAIFKVEHPRIGVIVSSTPVHIHISFCENRINKTFENRNVIETDWRKIFTFFFELMMSWGVRARAFQLCKRTYYL